MKSRLVARKEVFEDKCGPRKAEVLGFGFTPEEQQWAVAMMESLRCREWQVERIRGFTFAPS